MAGKIAWVDLTVENAEEIKDFYHKVVGWSPDPVAMDGYNDFNMIPTDSDDPSAGICHAKGTNANIPPSWMVYILVANLQESVSACRNNGGEVLSQLTDDAKYAMIKDPAGAICMLYQE
ncbi:MAG: VOC family protein [Kangiellaceae bacterium]|jgi:predicted enzyme related to lactoylglutathione lyase|nr:VOC family protein [Kangiellaceae bacterium]